jgi:hypothetical protein
MKIKFLLASVLFLWSTIYAQIPGFIEKWKVDLGTTNAAEVWGLGRDGSALIYLYTNSDAFGDTVETYSWVSPSGEVISTIPLSEFLPSGTSNGFGSFVVVLLLQSNLVVQCSSSTFPAQPGPMQVTQFTRSGATPQITKTQLLAPSLSYSSARDFTLSDFSCPERLMFVQQDTVLTCYRPAADITNALSALTLNSVSPGSAQLLVTSSQGGQLQLQGSTNLTNWQSLTNIQTTPGVTTVVVPTPDKNHYFYRGKSQ